MSRKTILQDGQAANTSIAAQGEKPALQPEPLQVTDFMPMLQTKGSNALATLDGRKRGGQMSLFSDKNGNTIRTPDGIDKYIMDTGYAKVKAIATGAALLNASPKYAHILHELHIQITPGIQNTTTPVVWINAAEFAKRRGISVPTAKKLLREFAQTYTGAAVKWAHTERGEARELLFTIIDAADMPGENGRKKDGNFYFRFGQTYFEHLKATNSVIHFPAALLAKTGTDYIIGAKAIIDKALNRNDPGADVRSVRSYLDAAGIDYAKYGKRKINKAGIDVTNYHWTREKNKFEKAMDALKEILTWHYCKPKAEKLTDAELEKLDANFEFWLSLYVKTTWRNYPEDKEYLAERAKIRADRKTRKAVFAHKQAVEAGLSPEEIKATSKPRRRRTTANREGSKEK